MNPNDKLSDEDIKVLVDMLLERLPAAWHDALIALEKGESLENILADMSNGHTIRILRRLGQDDFVDEWIRDFRIFIEVE